MTVGLALSIAVPVVLLLATVITGTNYRASTIELDSARYRLGRQLKDRWVLPEGVAGTRHEISSIRSSSVRWMIASATLGPLALGAGYMALRLNHLL